MNLLELKNIIDHTIEDLREYEKPEDIRVLVSLSESSVGARASTGIKYASMGFDWEHGQFRLEPEKSIVSKGNTFKDVKQVKCELLEGRKYYFCPKCEEKISKDDNFCRYCSQKIKIKEGYE